jgi:uncharacterized Tic20 family protein
MKHLVARFGIHNVISFIIMIAGVLLFVLTPFFYGVLNFDSDIFGVLVFLVGLVMFSVGLIIKLVKRKQHN